MSPSSTPSRDLRVLTILPRPCVHESDALPNAHPSFRSRLECLDEFGVPGFEVTVTMPLSHPHGEAQRRYRERLKARVRSLFGGFCYGCGANGSTPLEAAHVLPTGLSGPSRGTEARLLDVLSHPWAYVPLCRPCHVEWGGPERWT